MGAGYLPMRLAVLAAGLLLSVPVMAQGMPGLDQLPGQRFEILAETLPPVSVEPVPYVLNAPRRIERGDAVPIVPPGFTVTLFAAPLPHPRRIEVLPGGDVLVVQQGTGQVVLLRDEDGDGIADGGSLLASGFDNPFGIVLIPAGPWAGDLLLADVGTVWRIPIAREGTVTRVTPVDAFGTPEGHITRALAVDPQTGTLYVAVGSTQNIAVEPEVKATIQRFDANGDNGSVFARGLRNATGLRIEPVTNDLYAVVMERDGMGDGLVPDYLTRVSEGDDFGWPYTYAGGLAQPGYADRAPAGAAPVAPDVMFEAHSAPMDLVFLPDTWPEEFRGDAIVALKGSSNRVQPTGYKLVRVPFENGRPVGGYDNFATGFWIEGDEPAQVWGRPAALGILPDGGLLVADDFAGTIWKIMPPAP